MTLKATALDRTIATCVVYVYALCRVWRMWRWRPMERPAASVTCVRACIRKSSRCLSLIYAQRRSSVSLSLGDILSANKPFFVGVWRAIISPAPG